MKQHTEKNILLLVLMVSIAIIIYSALTEPGQGAASSRTMDSGKIETEGSKPNVSNE